MKKAVIEIELRDDGGIRISTDTSWAHPGLILSDRNRALIVANILSALGVIDDQRGAEISPPRRRSEPMAPVDIDTAIRNSRIDWRNKQG